MEELHAPEHMLARSTSSAGGRAFPIVQELLRKAVAGDDIARWAQCLAGIVKHAAPLCPAAMRVAYAEVTVRMLVGFQRLPQCHWCRPAAAWCSSTSTLHQSCVQHSQPASRRADAPSSAVQPTL